MAAAGYSGGLLFTLLVDDVKRHEWWFSALLAAGMIEGWVKSELSRRRNKTSP